MLILLDTPQDLDECGEELGSDVGELLTPLTRRKWKGRKFGLDNGAFASFSVDGFRRLLDRMLPHKKHCLFVAAPDVVGSAIRTLEVFEHWYPELRPWPIAIVAQDGAESLVLPWSRCSAVFVGGSTAFKLSIAAEQIIKAAQAMGKWVHVGRVNTPDRMDKFLALGVDSIDGTGLARYSHMRKAIKTGLPLLQETLGGVSGA